MSAQTLIERNSTEEPKLNKLNKTNSKSSTSSMLNSNGGGVFDEDDAFYDASELNNGDGLSTPRGGNPYTARLKHLQEIPYLDSVNDDSLFDTPSTSRHPSEIGAELSSPRLPKNASVALTSPLALPQPSQQPSVLDDPQSSLNDNLAQNPRATPEPVTVNVQNVDEDDDDEEETPLETPWTFWYDWCDKYTTLEDYENSLKKIVTVQTVEGFWSVFNNIIDVSKLENRYSYHLMRGDRRPIWEDSNNSEGGTWKIAVDKRDTSFMWKEMAMAAIGEQLSDAVYEKDDIVGISVGKREKNDNISIWNLDSQYARQAKLIEKVISLAPRLDLKFRDYKAHKSLTIDGINRQQSKGSYNKSKGGHNNHHHNGHQNYNLNTHISNFHGSNQNSRHHSPSGYQYNKQ